MGWEKKPIFSRLSGEETGQNHLNESLAGIWGGKNVGTPITLERIGLPPDTVLMIGDTAYDIEAAKKVQVDTIAFRSGGWSDSDLAGAIAIYDGPADLLKHYDDSPLVR